MSDMRDELNSLHLRFDELTEVVAQNSERLDGVEHRLDGVEHRLDGVEHRLDGVEHRLDGVEHRLDGVEHRLDGVEHQVVDLRAELAQFREENRKEHLELFATLCEEMYALHAQQRQEMASHFGAFQEWMSSQLRGFIEALDQRYVLRAPLGL